MRIGTITVEDAYKLAVRVGKRVIDLGEANGGKVTLEGIRDVFERSLPKKFRPIVTDNEQAFLQYYEKQGVSQEQVESIRKYAEAATMPKPNGKGFFIYVPKEKLDASSVELGTNLGHELFHTLSRGKTVAGKNELKEAQKRLRQNGGKFIPESDTSTRDIAIQTLLVDSFKIGHLANPNPPPEFSKLYSHLYNEKRCMARVRATLRTVFDPRLKPGEEKSISDLHLPIEKSINPNSIAVRPRSQDLKGLSDMLTEEARAYSISSALNSYGYKLPPKTLTINQVVSATFRRASMVLKGESAILAKKS